jgi:uncharacterized radical SAM superfamily Fe-S cluster-containing enzyme
MSNLIYKTKSVCPVCFKSIDAQVSEENSLIYLNKSCRDHGENKELIWQDNKENYIRWLEYGGLKIENYKIVEGKLKYPNVCTAALMVTNKCNLDCPVCFTKSKDDESYNPSLDELRDLLEYYKSAGGEGAPIEFCGGEPTVRSDLPELAQMAKGMGFDYIQLNTNGIKISQSVEYCHELKDSGITTVYLGFDGFINDTYIYKYNKNLLNEKIKAVENCRQAKLAVILVPCIKPSVNDEQIGNIIDFAKDYIPTVRGIYFQPLSYFGIYPKDNRKRITIPEILRSIEKQTSGEIPADSFLPGSCEHPQCSFNGYFLMDNNKKLKPITKFKMKMLSEDAPIRIRENIKKTWTYNEQKYLTIGGMAFQDVWNYDIERIKRCTIQIIGNNKNLIPLCKKYLTNDDGKKLYPGIN